jgi:ribosomal protein S6
MLWRQATTNSIMRELTFIANSNLSGEDLANLIKKTKEFIEKHEGYIVHDFSTKKIRLAYPIKKQAGGLLCSLDFELERGNISEFAKEIRENKNILRHIIINKELTKPKPPTLKPIKIQPKSKQAKIKIEELDKKLEEILQE